MPKVGMEPIRKAALVKATIAEIGQSGSLDITVTQIARRAGMSAALAHHYLGSKEEIFLAAMRHILTIYAAEVRGALLAAETPEARLKALLKASFHSTNFRKDVVAAWLNFWVMAQWHPQARRLLTIYEGRLHSTLIRTLRPLVGRRAPELATAVAALIDGTYLRQALSREAPDGQAAVALIWRQITPHLEAQAQD